jgi:hypothetical protein
VQKRRIECARSVAIAGYDARMAQRVGITVNIGAGAPIEVIRQLVDDLDTVCQFGGEPQYRAAVASAELAVLRRPTAWISPRDYDEFEFGIPVWGGAISRRGPVAVLPTALLAPAVSRYLAEYNPTQDATTSIETIRYSNPIEIVLVVGGLTLMALGMARDWTARRRVNAAVAADIENTVEARRIIREQIARRFVEGDIPLSAPQVDDLLTLDVARAMQALGNTNPDLRELNAGEDEGHP